MSAPFIFESNFEQGDALEWDSETDVEGILTFPHYTTLSREDVTAFGPLLPYRGAYAAQWRLTGDAADHTLIEGDIDIADTVTRYTRFYLFIGKDFAATADDTFNIYEVQGTANAVENAVGLRITATTDAVEIGVGQVAPTVFAPNILTKGQWYCVELVSVIQTVGTGTATLWLDNAQVATVGSLTNTAVLRGVLGTQNTLSTTTGTILIDAFVFDDTAPGPLHDRFPEVLWITKDTHICLGDSELVNVTLLPSTDAATTLTIHDTDRANTTESNIVARLHSLTASEPPIDLADIPVSVKRGAYLTLSSATVAGRGRAMVHIGRSQGYHSVGRIRQHAANRKNHPTAR